MRTSKYFRLSVLPAAGLGFLIGLLSGAPAEALPLGKTPGASLVIPYFEVDLDDPDGRTTLVTIGNVGAPVIAHVSVYSDWGLPVYAWDVYLAQDAFETFNLRDLVVYGNLPSSGSADALPGCANPLFRLPLPLSSVDLMQKQLTGYKFVGNSCYSQPREDSSLATGSLLVDALERCTEPGPWPAYPTDMQGYFADDQTVSRREVLWGDFTLVDPSNNFAEGFEAFPLKLAQGWSGGTFGQWEHPEIARQALPACNRMRYLTGGPFGAKTSFFVYIPPQPLSGPRTCNVVNTLFQEWNFAFFDEKGRRQGTGGRITYATSGRLDATELGIASLSGYVELETVRAFPPGEFWIDTTSLLLGGIEASGRFAVGFPSGPCTGASP